MLEGLFQGKKPWPPAGFGTRLREAAQFNRLFDNEFITLRAWIRQVREREHEIKEFVPFPAPEIAARTLATFLFGEDATIESDSQPDSLLELIEDNHLHARNQEAATTCPVEGEVFYKIDWDEDVSNRAIITPIAGGLALPLYRFGRLIEVAFFEEWKDDNTDKVWRHIELRQKEDGKCIIRHFLFEGSGDSLGVPRKLDEFAAAGLEVDSEELDIEIEDLLVRHVPFQRTARKAHGISIFHGKEGLVAALHALYSQDQHDAEMAKRRVAVAESYLRRDDEGNIKWDRDLDVFALAEDAAGALGADVKPVHAIEFTDSTVMGQRIAQRFDEFLLACGIAPQSAGRDVAGTAESGTARKLAQSLTLQTVAGAARYFKPALVDIINLASQVTRRELDSAFPEWDDTKVEMSDGFVDDEIEQAERISTLRTAGAMSVWQAVTEQHPDWDEAQVAEEVGRIIEEKGLAIPDVLDTEEGGELE